MNDDTARRLQIATESINTGHTSVVIAVTNEENNMLRRQLAAAKLVISGLDLRAAAHDNEIETLGAQAADVAGERAANAVLTTEVERLRTEMYALAMLYSTLTDAIGYQEGFHGVSPEEFAAVQRLDAKRYSWMRAECESFGGLIIHYNECFYELPWRGSSPDQCIDAAMRGL